MDLIINEQNGFRYIDLLKDKKIIETYKLDNCSHFEEGDIFIGTVKNILPGLQSAFVNFGDMKNGYLYIKDLLPKVDETKEKIDFSKKDIRKYINIEDNIIVQIKKKSAQTKGAKLSTHINLNGKYLVLMPNTSILTISKKITDSKKVQELKEIAKEKLPQNFGAIIRTKAGQNTQRFVEEIDLLIQKWNDINEKINNLETKSLEYLNKNRCVYKSSDLIEKLFLDYDFSEFKTIYVSSEKLKEEINQLICGRVAIEVQTSEELNTIFDLDKQKSKIENKKVWLKSGGFIVIEKTEALTTIDVNSGKFVGRNNLEDTIVKINKEATYEIANQLRLRDIGGIIIVDYIDMNTKEERQEIIDLLNEELKKDRTKYQVNGFTQLDLLEMTRKRLGFDE